VPPPSIGSVDTATPMLLRDVPVGAARAASFLDARRTRRDSSGGRTRARSVGCCDMARRREHLRRRRTTPHCRAPPSAAPGPLRAPQELTGDQHHEVACHPRAVGGGNLRKYAVLIRGSLEGVGNGSEKRWGILARSDRARHGINSESPRRPPRASQLPVCPAWLVTWG
jgi:hypothetical protein